MRLFLSVPFWLWPCVIKMWWVDPLMQWSVFDGVGRCPSQQDTRSQRKSSSPLSWSVAVDHCNDYLQWHGQAMLTWLLIDYSGLRLRQSHLQQQMFMHLLWGRPQQDRSNLTLSFDERLLKTSNSCIVECAFSCVTNTALNYLVTGSTWFSDHQLVTCRPNEACKLIFFIGLQSIN